jgi:hypothetical protein
MYINLYKHAIVALESKPRVLKYEETTLRRIKNKTKEEKARILLTELIAIRLTWDRLAPFLKNSFRKDDQARIILNIATNEFFKYTCLKSAIHDKDYVNIMSRGHAIMGTQVPKFLTNRV